MSVKLYVKNLNVKKLDKNLFTEFNDVDSSLTVNGFMERIVERLQLNTPCKLDLLCAGQLMKRNKRIDYYTKDRREVGVVLMENQNEVLEPLAKPNETDIRNLSTKLAAFLKNKKKRHQLENYLRKSSNIDKLCKSQRHLEQDPISYGFVQSIDLVYLLCDFERAKTVLETYPAIYYALTELLNAVLDELKRNVAKESNFISKSSYYIDDMSEDEDDGSAVQGHARTSQAAATPAISQDHFNAVLAALNQQQQQVQQQPPRNSIDRDFFSNIMQQVIQSSLSTAQHPTTPAQAATVTAPTDVNQTQPTTSSSTATQASSGLSDEVIAVSLEKMHEFGFWDDEKNMRALQITEGNVEAAISLLVEGIDI